MINNSQNIDTKKQLDVEKIRQDFPILHQEMRGKPMIFLDNAASSQKPKVVIDAIENYYEHTHANVHRGVYELSQKATDAFELGRTTVRQYINAASDQEVIFTRGTTEGINLVASCFGRQFLKEGDEVLISTMEHHSNIVPWQMICEQQGAKLKVIPIDDHGDIIWEEFEKLLTDRVKIVSLVHVSNSLGTINPIEEVIELSHKKGIPVLIDGAQATPHFKVDVQALDVDFYVFSSHKVYGPTGMGILYGKKKWLEAMPPYQGGGEMIANVSFEKTTYNELPFKFEAGTPNISGAVGLGVALDYMDGLGVEQIAAHENDLLTYGTQLLKEIEGLRVIGEAKKKASVISFLVDGVHPYDLGTLLDKQGIAVRTGHHCTQPLMDFYGIPGTVRASFGIYNTREEVELLAKGVQRAVDILK